MTIAIREQKAAQPISQPDFHATLNTQNPPEAQRIFEALFPSDVMREAYLGIAEEALGHYRERVKGTLSADLPAPTIYEAALVLYYTDAGFNINRAVNKDHPDQLALDFTKEVGRIAASLPPALQKEGI